MEHDSYTEVTSQSWFSRLGNAFKGIVAGIIFLVLAFPLLFWNEGRAVKRYKTLKEGSGAVISIAADQVDRTNEGRLVHLSGLATTEETLVDQRFGIRVQALKLLRTVEMYQWKETKKTEKKKKFGGSEEQVTTYSYSHGWSESLVDSKGFRKPQGHENPDHIPYRTRQFIAKDATVGAFSLPVSLVRKINTYEPVLLDESLLIPGEYTNRAERNDNILYLGNNPDAPEIGDLRITFKKVEPTEVSLVARQAQSTFEPYEASTGDSIELLQTGDHSAASMFHKAQQDNMILTWALRGGGALVMFIGLRLIIGPLAVFADVIPLFGAIVGFGASLIAGLLTAGLSLFTIGIAWIFYRPLFGLLLFVIAGLAGGLIVLQTKRKAGTPPPLPTR